MLQTAEERASSLKAWVSKHPGRQPPVHILAPGLDAPRRPSRTQREAVQRVYRSHAADLLNMEREQIRLFAPVLAQARAELAQQLQHWIHRTPDGELRWSAWKYRSALAQMHIMAETLQRRIGERLELGGLEAQKLALTHLITETARFSKFFGDEPPQLQLNLARILSEGRAALVPQFQASAERYSFGTRNSVFTDLNHRLAVDILKGAPLHETVDRLQLHGGPRGYVAVRGHGDDAEIEYIPEGLFARYRWRAEMLVRTEIASAYGWQMREGLFAARETLPDLLKRWSDDGSGCRHICNPMDGQTVALEDPFVTGDGVTIESEPAHPNCRCRSGPWRAHWGALLDSLGVAGTN